MSDLPTPAAPATRPGAIVRPTWRVRVSGVAPAHPVLEGAVDVAAHHEGPHEHRGCELPDGRGGSDVVTQGREARTVGGPTEAQTRGVEHDRACALGEALDGGWSRRGHGPPRADRPHPE